MWALHWLNASGNLEEYQAEISACAHRAEAAVFALYPHSDIDVLIQQAEFGIIPLLGIGGRAWNARLFSILVQPENPNFNLSISNGALNRQFIHEAHHSLRMGSVGYGMTLAGALVSEGLAGHFVRMAAGSEPEPWERALSPEQLCREPLHVGQLWQQNYNHAEWFWGRGSLPLWFGYSFGYLLIGEWLKMQPFASAEKLVNVTANEVITTMIDLPNSPIVSG